MSTSSARCGFEPPCHAVADLPADVSEVLLRLTASDAALIPRADPIDIQPRPDGQPYFEIYRADEVRLTSILFSGGDWRWRFCSGAGVPIATSAGYATERQCAASVAALRNGAAAATVRSCGSEISTPRKSHAYRRQMTRAHPEQIPRNSMVRLMV